MLKSPCHCSVPFFYSTLRDLHSCLAASHFAWKPFVSRTPHLHICNTCSGESATSPPSRSLHQIYSRSVRGIVSALSPSSSCTSEERIRCIIDDAETLFFFSFFLFLVISHSTGGVWQALSSTLQTYFTDSIMDENRGYFSGKREIKVTLLGWTLSGYLEISIFYFCWLCYPGNSWKITLGKCSDVSVRVCLCLPRTVIAEIPFGLRLMTSQSPVFMSKVRSNKHATHGSVQQELGWREATLQKIS